MGIDHLISSLLSDSRIKINTVRQFMYPSMVISWIFGMGIIECPPGKEWPIASFIYTIMLMIVYGIATHVSIINIDTMIDGTTRMARQIFLFVFYVHIFLNYFCTLLAWMRIKKMNNIIHCLEESDARMEKMGIPRDYKIVYIRQMLNIILLFSIVSIFMVLTNITSVEYEVTIGIKIANTIAIYYPIFITTLGNFAFVSLVRFMNMRFNQLNEFLLSMSTTTENSPQHKRVLDYSRLKKLGASHTVLEKRTNDDCNAMKAARDYHYLLVTISSKISDTFGIHLLLTMTVSFALMTGFLYNACSLLLWSKLSQETIFDESVFLFGWIFYYINKVITVNSACASASAAAKKTGYIICHLHEPSTRKEFKDEIRDFSFQLTHHSLSFTACGFFTLNYEFIQAMISSITTYLVILIQIGEVPSATDSENTTMPWEVSE